MIEEDAPIDVEDSVICPICGHEQEITVTPTVNVTSDPEMREKVISDEIFLFTCDKCGFRGFAGFPMVYEDKETNGGFLLYLEPDCEDREVGIEGDIADQVIYREKPMRLVTDVNSLKEKIYIFEAGLDDRVMELFKMLALTKLVSDDESKKPDELRFMKIDAEGEDEIVCLAAFREGQCLGTLELPYALYQTCVITGGPIWDVPVTECAAVDQRWILERMKEAEEEESHDGCKEEDCAGCAHHCPEK
ncbi:MAG TPA: CpXC domain-containing protein [Methanocorpusculum sp.]|nr:CpXC domain-containing protein [Methanocorpusculum sp.]